MVFGSVAGFRAAYSQNSSVLEDSCREFRVCLRNSIGGLHNSCFENVLRLVVANQLFCEVMFVAVPYEAMDRVS